MRAAEAEERQKVRGSVIFWGFFWKLEKLKFGVGAGIAVVALVGLGVDLRWREVMWILHIGEWSGEVGWNVIQTYKREVRCEG